MNNKRYSEKTYQTALNRLKEIQQSGKTISEYYNTVAETSIYSLRVTISNFRKDDNPKTRTIREQVINLYESLKGKRFNKEITKTEKLDSDSRIETYVERNEEGQIVNYRYKIYKENKPALDGHLDRDEMSKVMRLYTYEGDNKVARAVSREFPQFSLQDFKRIVRAFAIYKDSCPFAAHDIEEKSEEELKEIQLREKENKFMRGIEEDRIKDNEKLLKKYALENIELKKKLNDISNISIDTSNIEPYYIHTEDSDTNSAVNIYLSDVHLGAAVETGSLFDENINYGFDEAKRRLEEMIQRLAGLGVFDTVNLCLMGDNIDCCGFKGYTASMSHQMPENMDPRDQFNKFIDLYDWLIRSLDENRIFTKELNVYSVPTGNHSGSFEFALNNTLKYYTEAKFPGVKFTLFDKFFGVFEQNSVKFCLTHGKNDQFMKHGLPLNLDDKNKVKIYEWLDDNKIYGDNIHIVKGDLHSNNLNSCKRFSYRNVLSLFGSSDYSAYGFSRNSYGISYDLIIGNNVISGTFENM